MKQIKIIFFDIDGTLINIQAEKMSDKTIETLKQLKKNGIKICIATGRPSVTLPVFEGIEFDAYLTFNGSLCYNDSGIIFSNPIAMEAVKKIIQNASDIGRPVSVATKKRLASNGTDDDLEEYYSFAHQEIDVAEDFEAVCKEEIYQMMMGCQEWEYDAVFKDVKGAKITAWWSRAVDIIPDSGGKGVGVQKILEYYGFDQSEALAFGDGDNDIEMLQTVGTGVAMGNASLGLKAVADEVCGHVADDGIYNYCSQHGLI